MNLTPQKLGVAAFYVLLIRLFLGYVFFSSGLCKLSRGEFPGLIGPCNLETALAPYDLTLFALLIAVAQFVIGALVLSQRYALVGSIMMVPMNVSIFVFTVSQGWQGTPYIDAFLLLLNCVLLLYHFSSLTFFLFPEEQKTRVPTRLDLAFDRFLPHLALGVALCAALTSRVSSIVMMCFAALALLFFYLVVLRSASLSRPEKGVVVLSFAALALASVLIATADTFVVFSRFALFGLLLTVVAVLIGFLLFYTVQQWTQKRYNPQNN
jgi:uncharacterized membrane protein YphA (DoxX/SURF4 family)